MTLNELNNSIEYFKKGETERCFLRVKDFITYSNDYIKVIRIDSSNKWVSENKMAKMWSIIFELKKNFTSLTNYKNLCNEFDIKITPVTKGMLKGCYGLRIYNMKRNPNREIILDILNYIFEY